MKVYNLKEKLEYLEEVATLELKEWGKFSNPKLIEKITKIRKLLEHDNFAKLILLDKDKLIGFISLFPTDGEYRTDLTPWYATMYIKEEYRGHGYSKMLNDSLINYAKSKKYSYIYLKTELNNYYEKFGFTYLEELPNKEKLYYMDLRK